MARTRKRIALVGFAVFTLYTGSYALLSLEGEYVPQAWGLGWVKWYVWAPRGFVSGRSGLKQNRLLQRFFLPLWLIDTHWIHPSENAGENGYPINTTLDDALQKRLRRMEEKQSGNQNPSSPPTNTQPSKAEQVGPKTSTEGLPVEWLKKHGLSTTEPVADLDPDGDGFTNREEFVAGTNPRDPKSHPDWSRSSGMTSGGTRLGSRVVAAWSNDVAIVVDESGRTNVVRIIQKSLSPSLKPRLGDHLTPEEKAKLPSGHPN